MTLFLIGMIIYLLGKSLQKDFKSKEQNKKFEYSIEPEINDLEKFMNQENHADT